MFASLKTKLLFSPWLVLFMTLASHVNASFTPRFTQDSVLFDKYSDSITSMDNQANKISYHKNIFRKLEPSDNIEFKNKILYNHALDFNKMGKFIKSSRVINQAEELKKQKKLKNILIICIVVIILMTILTLRNRFLKVKKNKLLQEQNKKITRQNIQLKKAHNELQKKKQEVEQNRNKIEKQKDKLQEQFNIIQSKNWEMSNSFEYAGHIQSAILPDRELLIKYFEDYFILLRPTNIVSGDFYWFSKISDKILITVADCTGHGVAGGLLSMLGISYLNEIVNIKKITSPETILDELRATLINALKQEKANKSYLSGIDMAVVSINKDKNIVEYAGANNPLYIVRENELHEYVADKMPIAYYDKMASFNKQIIPVKEGDQIYLFSDGYTDQFGGKNQKKFKFKPFRKLIVENNRKTMEEQKTALNQTFEIWKGNLVQVDDVLVMGIKL